MKVLVYPRDSNNPYQQLLYAAVHAVDPTIELRYVRSDPRFGALLLPLRLAGYRLLGYRVVHVHWQTFVLPRWFPFARRLAGPFFALCVATMRLLGLRILWTVHNLVPHNPVTADDTAATRRLARAAGAIVVHSQLTRERLVELTQPSAPVLVAAHGSYHAHYPPAGSRADARRELGLPPDAVVLLYLGIIRPYKGVPELIDAFRALPEGAAVLVIAGDCQDPDVRERLRSPGPAIRFVDAFVPDDQIGTYFGAADLACLPFRKAATSGSAILAASYGKPVIASRVGDLLNLPEEIGFFFAPGDRDGLRAAVERAVTDDAARARAGTAAADRRPAADDWQPIAEAVADALHGLQP